MEDGATFWPREIQVGCLEERTSGDFGVAVCELEEVVRKAVTPGRAVSLTSSDPLLCLPPYTLHLISHEPKRRDSRN